MNGTVFDYLKSTGGLQLDDEVDCPGKYKWECPKGWYEPRTNMVHIGVSMASSSMSVVGAILTIAPYIIWKDVRTGIRAIITFLAVADFLTASSYLMGTINYIVYRHHDDNEHEALVPQACEQFYNVCQIQSFLSCWFSMSSFLWTGILALHLYTKVSVGNSSVLNRWFPLNHVISWGLPILLVLPLLIAGNLGYSVFAAGGWCFVKADKDPSTSSVSTKFSLSAKAIVTILVGGKAVEISAYIWVMVLFCLMYRKIHRKRSNMLQEELVSKKLLVQVEKKLYAIPVVFVMLRIWGTLQFFLSTVVFNIPEISKKECFPVYLYCIYYFLAIVQSIGDGGQGWCNFLLYVMWSEKIRSRLLLNPAQSCCLKVTNYLASSSVPSQNYGIINEAEGESSNTSIKYRRKLLEKISNPSEHSALLIDRDKLV